MKILITNDDGISSPVLPGLVRWARKHGEVTLVAPKHEQSAKSQAIEIRKAMEIKRVVLDNDVEAYAVDSTPADCVRFGVLGLEMEYDLVISGINKGFNVGDDIAYSGTVAAIFEGARFGIKGIALSTDQSDYSYALNMLDSVWEYIESEDLFSMNELYNVNIPVGSSKIKITHQGRVFFSDAFEYRGNDMYAQTGEPVKEDKENPDSDINAICNRMISITPLTERRTNVIAYKRLKS